MTAVLEGVRVLEVAEHTFVPAASALLADWGAEVIKIEPIERGDAMRGLAATGVVSIGGDVHALSEHSNRGKRSLALDLDLPRGPRDPLQARRHGGRVPHQQAPGVRQKLKIELEDIRAHNPNIIYVAGTGQGERGPEADKGSYDSLSFWYRAGVSIGVKPAESARLPAPPAPGLRGLHRCHDHRRGDHGGAVPPRADGRGHHRRRLTARHRDVGHGPGFRASLLSNVPWRGPPADRAAAEPIGPELPDQGRALALLLLPSGQPVLGRALCEIVGRPELGTDPRFADHAALLEHSTEARATLEVAFAERTVVEWRERLADFSGQWASCRTRSKRAVDPQSVANGYVQDCETAAGVALPARRGPGAVRGGACLPPRAPEFNEHGDAILEELGIDWDTIVDLKVRSVVG